MFINEAAVNVPVPAFWWTDVAFLLGVYLSMSASSDRLHSEQLPQYFSYTQTHIHTHTRSQVLTSLHPLASSVFLIFASLIGVR